MCGLLGAALYHARVAGRLLVLYVEDNDANFTLVDRVLGATGRYHVQRATDAEHALKLLEGWASQGPEAYPALFLLDLDLPGMDGIDLARHIKSDAKTQQIPIVVVTASVMQRERRRALEAGADAFVEKPFDIEAFRRVVDSVLSVSDDQIGTI